MALEHQLFMYKGIIWSWLKNSPFFPKLSWVSGKVSSSTLKLSGSFLFLHGFSWVWDRFSSLHTSLNMCHPFLVDNVVDPVLVDTVTGCRKYYNYTEEIHSTHFSIFSYQIHLPQCSFIYFFQIWDLVPFTLLKICQINNGDTWMVPSCSQWTNSYTLLKS